MPAHIFYDLNPLIISVINKNVSPINPIKGDFKSYGMLTRSIFKEKDRANKFPFTGWKVLDIALIIFYDCLIGFREINKFPTG